MRKLYLNQNVDYNDGNTEFIHEFNDEIELYGAIVYNFDNNTYQFIERFEDIDFIHELYPWYFKVKRSTLPKGIDIEMVYDFDPELFQDDDEIMNLWQAAVDEGMPVFDYDDEGEIYHKDTIPLSHKPTHHVIWILNEKGKELIASQDRLILFPVFKYIDLPKQLIKEHVIEPFDD